MPYRFPFDYQVKRRAVMTEVCSEWQEEQFKKAVVKRSAHIAAWEALRRQVRHQREDHGVTIRTRFTSFLPVTHLPYTCRPP